MRTIKTKTETIKAYYLPATRLDAQRIFDASQRDQAIYAAQGRCRGCGCGSIHNLQCDHWYPYSKGGLTITENAIALCSGCNKVKGDTIPPKGYELPIFKSVVSEENQSRNHEHFATLVANWKSQEQNGLIEYGKAALKAGRTLRVVLNDMWLKGEQARKDMISAIR